MWQRISLKVVFASGLVFSIALSAVADPTAKPVLSVQGKDARSLPNPLPSSLFLGRTAEAYRVATEIPEVLAGLACYCGCDKSAGHRYLLDCFADDHGAG